jgi:hypothetical protein
LRAQDPHVLQRLLKLLHAYASHVTDDADKASG